MQSDGSTIGAAVMFIGLLTGFFPLFLWLCCKTTLGKHTQCFCRQSRLSCPGTARFPPTIAVGRPFLCLTPFRAVEYHFHHPGLYGGSGDRKSVV